MALLKPIWMQATGGDPALQYSANELREFLRGLIRTEGVLDTVGSALKVTQRGAGANFSVDIQAGHAAVLGDDVADQGMYLLRNTAALNVATPSAPGAGTRIHRVVAQVRDKTHSGTWTTYDWTPVLLQDTGGGTPAVPASALPLARVSITAGQASVLDANITDDRANAGLLHGLPPGVSSDAGRPAAPAVGERIWRTDKLCWEIWSGAVWAEEYVGGIGPAWKPYTPVWTGATTNPVIGLGTITGRYLKVGRSVQVVIEILPGSNTTYGSGAFRVSLPFTAVTVPEQCLHGRFFDTSTGVAYAGSCSLSGLTYAVLQGLTVTGTDIRVSTLSQGSPTVTWANGDALRIWGTYEATS